MKLPKYYLCFLMAILWSVSPLKAQQTSQFSSLKHRIGLDFRPGIVLQDNSFVKRNNVDGKPNQNAYSAHLKYSFQFSKGTKWGDRYPYAYQGIGVSYNSLNNHDKLGSPVAVYVFQGSRIAQITSKLSLDYEWNFGVSFGWKKFESFDNVYKGVVGSKINAYINLGFLLNWQITSQWNLTGGLDLTHYSNGNTSYPNPGVNLIGGRVGLVRTFGKETDSNTAHKSDRFSSERNTLQSRLSYDLIVYGATRKRAVLDEVSPYMIPGSFGILGLNFNPMYRLNSFFGAGLSLDMQYDESANVEQHYAGGDSDNPKFYQPSFSEQFSVGFSARGELIMPIFTVNLGIGYNVLQNGKDTKGWYQIAALKTFITRRLFLHVGYQLSKFKDPNNLMLGMGWKF